MTNSQTTERLRVLHVISGDLWAGAEVQACTLLVTQAKTCDVCAVILNPGTLADKLKSNGITTHVINEQAHSTVQLFFRLLSTMREFKPVIVHTHRVKEHFLGALAQRFIPRSRCIRTVHGRSEHTTGFKSRLLNRLDNFVGNHFQSLIISVSSELHSELVLEFPRTPVITIINGIDVKSVQRQAEHQVFEFGSDRPRVGFVGRLVPVKRADIFLDVARLSNQAGLDMSFHLFGDGPQKDMLAARVKTEELQSTVTLHGHQENMAAIIDGLDAIIMCSDHEGTPMTALEAMALGTPLLVNNTTGLAALAKEFPQITVVQNNRAEGYIWALKRLSEHKVQYDTNAISAERNCAETLAAYQGLL